MRFDSFKKTKLPDSPGVYFFLGPPKRGVGGSKGREIIYIGKATSLRGRVKSYFGQDLIEIRGPIILEMIFKADKIKWEKTDSVLEALIREAELIKKHQPKYNTKEKSDKSFNYVCITKEKLPKVIVVRGKNLHQKQENSPRSSLPGVPGGSHTKKNFLVSGASIYGPFTNGGQLREALKIIRRIFPFLDEKSKSYMEFYRQINLVPDLNDRQMYLQNIRNLKLFFQGKKKRILQNLKKEMNAYSKKREFEKAGEIKRQIFALQHINDVALIKNDKLLVPRQNVLEGTLGRSDGDGQRKFSAENFRGESENILPGNRAMRIEAYDVAHLGGKNMVGAMTVVVNGEVEKSEYKKFKIRTQDDANDTGALKEVLERRFRHAEWPFPGLIVVDGGIAQINATRAVLAKIGMSISVVSVLKNDQHQPKNILGDQKFALKYKQTILLSNSEAHRFAIAYHKKTRNKNFLK